LHVVFVFLVGFDNVLYCLIRVFTIALRDFSFVDLVNLATQPDFFQFLSDKSRAWSLKDRVMKITGLGNESRVSFPREDTGYIIVSADIFLCFDTSINRSLAY